MNGVYLEKHPATDKKLLRLAYNIAHGLPTRLVFDVPTVHATIHPSSPRQKKDKKN